MCSSTPSVRASRQAAGSSRSRPRSRAKWLRVPAEMTIIGISRAGGDARDQGLGAVAAGHPEQVGSAVDGLPGQRGHVDDPGTLQQGHLGAARGGLVGQAELRDLAAARPRVHDQERPLPRRGGVFARPGRQAATDQRRAPGRHGGDRERDGQRDLPQQPGDDVHDDHQHRRGDQDRERQPAPDAAVGQEPPRRRAGDRQAREAEEQRGDAPQRAREQQHQHRGSGGGERQPGQPALTPGGPGWRSARPAHSLRRAIAPRDHIITHARHASPFLAFSDGFTHRESEAAGSATCVTPPASSPTRHNCPSRRSPGPFAPSGKRPRT